MTQDPRKELFQAIANLRMILRFAHERRHLHDQQAVIAQKVEQALSLATRILQDPIFADIAPGRPAPRKPAPAPNPERKEPRAPRVPRVPVQMNIRT